jgi:hypothetical protein
LSEIEQVAPGVCNVKLMGKRFIRLTGAIKENEVLLNPNIIMAFVATTIYGNKEDLVEQKNGLECTRIMTNLPGASTIDVIETPEQIDEIFAQLEADNRKDIAGHLKQIQSQMNKQILPAGPLTLG